MAEPAAKKQSATMQVAILVAICVVVLNVVFYLLSGSYFDSKRGAFGAAPITDAQIHAARMQFVWFTVIVGAAAVAASFAARTVGHAIAALIGLASFVTAIYALGSSLPKVLGVTLLVLGALMPLLAYLSLFRHVRAAWAFLVAMTTTYATVLLFGAPKVRGQLWDIGLWTALIFPGLLVVAAVALTLVRHEYREPVKR